MLTLCYVCSSRNTPREFSPPVHPCRIRPLSERLNGSWLSDGSGVDITVLGGLAYWCIGCLYKYEYLTCSWCFLKVFKCIFYIQMGFFFGLQKTETALLNKIQWKCILRSAAPFGLKCQLKGCDEGVQCHSNISYSRSVAVNNQDPPQCLCKVASGFVHVYMPVATGFRYDTRLQ